MRKNIDFYAELLQDEADSKMDLEYWIEYVDKFNVGHKIPLYDHMSFFTYHNLELWSFVAIFLYVLYRFCKFILTKIYSTICSKKETKVKTE